MKFKNIFFLIFSLKFKMCINKLNVEEFETILLKIKFNPYEHRNMFTFRKVFFFIYFNHFY